MRVRVVVRFVLTGFVLLWLAGAVLAQSVKIEGQDLPYRLVNGKQMISRALLAKAFPGFQDGKGEVDLAELLSDGNARVVRRDGLIVSVRYYDSAMSAWYNSMRQTAARPAAGAAVVPVADGDYAGLMKEVVRLSNIERANNGAPPLTVDHFLEIAALGHSQEMARLGYFDHTSPTPGRETPDVRIHLAGSSAPKTGENLAMFSGHPEAELAEKAVVGWMNSPGHRRNLLDPGFTHIGIGVAKSSGGEYYITQNFCAY